MSITYWFVGAAYGPEDQTERFLRDGIWENGYDNKYLDLVKSVKVGDRIALKAAYTKKNGLPFDNREHTVSVMKIKAIGTVTANTGDGKILKVNWTQLSKPKEWYFYTGRTTIWEVRPDSWEKEALIDFTFNNKSQDIDKFRNIPRYTERFGDAPEVNRFEWTTFYESVADALLQYKNDRSKLIEGIHNIAANAPALGHLTDQYADGTSGPLKDICPFTVMGLFNRQTSKDSRKIIAQELAHFLNVSIPVPDSFDGVPFLNNMGSWFFDNDIKRKYDDIDSLWDVFDAAIKLSNDETEDNIERFINAFDDAMPRRMVSWKLTMGLYWIRPWDYPTLDTRSREYITKKLGLPADFGNRLILADKYLDLINILSDRFSRTNYSVHSYPELSYNAWEAIPPPIEPEHGDKYTLDNIMSDGCFIDMVKLSQILDRLKNKKNLILQGPPGTGKTWLAKRLAYALIGEKDTQKVRSFQFHPNLSYEDFVRGWRPSGEGKLTLEDGPFMQTVSDAKKEPQSMYVMVIEEINRGNPAQIFGELLTLLEADKRNDDEALELCYPKHSGERVYIPSNVYVIGTMNIADRSLSIVDFAFRRRFAFADLEPLFNSEWHNWAIKYCSEDIVEIIKERINKLNSEIYADSNLGKQFCIGHSFFTPMEKLDNAKDWYTGIIETEIIPLLNEYWFDSPLKVKEHKDELLKSF